MQEKNWKTHDLTMPEPEHEDNKFARAIYSFEARTEDELSLVSGEYISIVQSNNTGWWEVGLLVFLKTYSLCFIYKGTLFSQYVFRVKLMVKLDTFQETMLS